MSQSSNTFMVNSACQLIKGRITLGPQSHAEVSFSDCIPLFSDSSPPSYPLSVDLDRQVAVVITSMEGDWRGGECSSVVEQTKRVAKFFVFFYIC